MVDSLKVQGDFVFRQQNYQQAIQYYQKALEYINFEKKDNQQNVIIDKTLTVNFLNNMTQCYLNLNQGEYSKNLCNFILSIDKSNLKAQYRLGKAYELLNEPEKAKLIYNNAIKQTSNKEQQKPFQIAL